jgi:predicted RNA-binding protein with PIN domain
MKFYIIDGNNLIGKNKSLSSLQKKDKQSSREKLAFMIHDYFHDKKIKIYLHFDGYQNLPINVPGIKITYSEKLSADEKIKQQIENSKDYKNILLISSDNNLREFAKVCGCNVISSEEFLQHLNKNQKLNEEQTRIDSISNDEIKRLFDA